MAVGEYPMKEWMGDFGDAVVLVGPGWHLGPHPVARRALWQVDRPQTPMVAENSTDYWK
jgi:hypothetical protein